MAVSTLWASSHSGALERSACEFRTSAPSVSSLIFSKCFFISFTLRMSLREGRKEMFYLTTHSTQARKEMFYLTTHSTQARKERFYLMTHSTQARKQGNVLFNDALNTSKEGSKEMFYLTRHSTHFIYGYMASDIW